MTTIEITATDKQLTVDSPYHPDWPAQARQLGGKFAAGVWTFSARDEQRVRDLCREVYGTDGTPTQTVTVTVPLRKWSGEQTVWFAGRRIAHRPGRDQRVILGDDVVVAAGQLKSSGGSMKNPRLGDYDMDVVLEVRDVPVGHSDLAIDGVQVVDTGAVDTDALTAEREQLLARVAEIDALLPEPEGTEVDTRQAAQALGVSVRTVQRWAAQGRVQAHKDNGRWIITITIATEV
jgi:hypothetical protein